VGADYGAIAQLRLFDEIQDKNRQLEMAARTVAIRFQHEPRTAQRVSAPIGH
jgi:hypothetical protein